MLKYINELMLSLKSFLCIIYNKIFDLFTCTLIEGDLTVTGSDGIEIDLGFKLPTFIQVSFKDKIIIPTCNPLNCDEFMYELELNSDESSDCFEHYILKIYWTVSASRQIQWKVIY